MDMNEIKEIFFQECEEQLAELETGLLALNDGDTDPETVNAVFRAVHSIKGGAGAFGLDDLVGFAHVFETTLDCVRSQTLEPTPDVLKVMLRSADILADLTAAAREGGSVDAERTGVLAKELEALARGEAPEAAVAPAPPKAPAAAAPAAEAAPVSAEPETAPAPTDDSGFQPVPFSFDDFGDEDADAGDAETASEGDDDGEAKFTVRFKPRSDLYANGNETVLLLRDLAKLGEMHVRCETEDLPPIDKLDPEGAYLSWIIEIRTTSSEDEIRSVFEFAEWDCQLEIAAGAADVEVTVAATGSPDEEAPMAPVPFDLSLLEDEAPIAAEVQAEAPAAEAAAPQAEQPVASDDLPAPELPAASAAIAANNEKQKAASVAAVPAAPQTIRVDLDRVDRLINLVGELVINQAMLAQSVVENETGGAVLSAAIPVALGPRNCAQSSAAPNVGTTSGAITAVKMFCRTFTD